MDEFEKVEKLREKANVSYEEARDALRASDGDILDAMVYLENLGKVQAPKYSQYTTSSEDNYSQYSDVKSTVSAQERKADSESFGSKVGSFINRVWKQCCDIHFIAKHKDSEVINVPLWGLLLVLLLAWHACIVLFIISLFFEWRYNFISESEMDLHQANKAMDVCSNTAEDLKNSFNNSKQ